MALPEIERDGDFRPIYGVVRVAVGGYVSPTATSTIFFRVYKSSPRCGPAGRRVFRLTAATPPFSFSTVTFLQEFRKPAELMRPVVASMLCFLVTVEQRSSFDRRRRQVFDCMVAHVTDDLVRNAAFERPETPRNLVLCYNIYVSGLPPGSSGEAGREEILDHAMKVDDDEPEQCAPGGQEQDVSDERRSLCCICLEELEDGEREIMETSCSHVFHADCLWDWFARKNSCPLCRHAIYLARSRVQIPD